MTEILKKARQDETGETSNVALKLRVEQLNRLVVATCLFWAVGFLLIVLLMSFGVTPKQQTKLWLIAFNLYATVVIVVFVLRKNNLDNALNGANEKSEQIPD